MKRVYFGISSRYMKKFFSFFIEPDAALMAVLVVVYWALNVGFAGYFLYTIVRAVGPFVLESIS